MIKIRFPTPNPMEDWVLLYLGPGSGSPSTLLLPKDILNSDLQVKTPAIPTQQHE